MKTFLATCIALSFFAGTAAQASTALSRKHKHYASRYAGVKSYAYRAANHETPSWYPHDSSVLPFGTQLWWRQKEAESGGSHRP